MESKLSRALAPKRPDAPTLTSRQLVKAWWQALRPPFFIVDLIPVGLGGALAARDLGYWPWGIFAVVMVGCFCLHTVANSFIPVSGGLPSEDTGNTRRAWRRRPPGKTAPKDAGNTLNAADAMLKIGTASGGRGSTLPPEALPFILFRLPSADCPPGGRCP